MKEGLASLSEEINKIERDYGESSLSVEEVLKIPAFEGYEVLGGHQGLKNRCMHLPILETPDGIEWLTGGEFLLSAGYALKDNKSAFKNIMFRMHKRGVAAFAIKERRYIDEIPIEMIEQANVYGIPLIKLPKSVVYTGAVSSFYEALFYKKNEYLLQAKTMHERLLNLVFESKDMKGTVDALSALTTSSIIVYDSVFNLLASSIYNPVHEHVCRNIMENENLSKDIIRQCEQSSSIKHEGFYLSCCTILSGRKTAGYMYIVSDTQLDSLNKTAVEQGRMILSLKMSKEENELLSQIRINKSITEIILNNEKLPGEFYFNIKNNFGWNNKDMFVGLAVKLGDAIDDMELTQIRSRLYALIGRIFNEEGFLVSERPESIYLFFSIEDVRNIGSIIDKILTYTKHNRESVKLSFTISRVYNNVSDIPQMYRECHIASLFSKEGETLYYESLDTIRLLYSLKEDRQVVEQYNKTIRKLEEYDLKNRGELLSTLEAYFKYDMNRKLVADKLFIHIETLRYRLSKIESLTGQSLNTSEGIFVLQMNLKLHKILMMQ